MVFAPHQDDESLGCGGTIILKREAGVPVKLVFMTDGSTSHSRFVGKSDLHRIRNEEALQAAGKLGLDRADVEFLDFPDSQLGESEADAVARVLKILHRCGPDEVFIPYRLDGTPDHEATNRILVSAVSQYDRPIRVCEYPIWLWNSWPWVPLQLPLNRGAITEVRRTIKTGCGLDILRKFRSGAFVGDKLHAKFEALAQHRSQMTQLIEGVGWPTLADVSEGEFLRCFKQDFEVFHCWNSARLKS